MDNQNVSTSLHCVKYYIYIWDGPEDVEDFVFYWKKKKTTLTKHWISHSVDRLVYEHWSLACMLPPWNQFLTITELHLDSLHHLQRSALQVKKKEVPQQRREKIGPNLKDTEMVSQQKNKISNHAGHESVLRCYILKENKMEECRKA